ncbi:MAG TPA: phosphatidate cytidylyltransferase [Chloroflexi bacterium]|nr:phosphatidate cytidylyltransferase [Chloroflexota bacterium]
MLWSGEPPGEPGRWWLGLGPDHAPCAGFPWVIEDRKNRLRASVLRKRVLSALILGPLVLGIVVAGPLWFAGLVSLAVLIAAWEYARLMERGGFRLSLLWTWGSSLVGLAIVGWPGWDGLRPALTFLLMGSITRQMVRRDRPAPVAEWALTVGGGLYLGLLGGHLAALRATEQGLFWLLLLLLVTWAVDSGAYFVGSAWGRHKIAPHLSPGKSWEGFWGGEVSGVGVGALLGHFLGVGLTHGLAVGVLVATLGLLGDLAVSMMKRQAGVKDSGHLIPGHGGMLDRIDSLLFAGVVGYYYVLWVVGA